MGFWPQTPYRTHRWSVLPKVKACICDVGHYRIQTRNLVVLMTNILRLHSIFLDWKQAPNFCFAWERDLYFKVDMMFVQKNKQTNKQTKQKQVKWVLFWSEQCTKCTCLEHQKQQKLRKRVCFWSRWVEILNKGWVNLPKWLKNLVSSGINLPNSLKMIV